MDHAGNAADERNRSRHHDHAEQGRFRREALASLVVEVVFANCAKGRPGRAEAAATHAGGWRTLIGVIRFRKPRASAGAELDGWFHMLVPSVGCAGHPSWIQ